VLRLAQLPDAADFFIRSEGHMNHRIDSPGSSPMPTPVQGSESIIGVQWTLHIGTCYGYRLPKSVSEKIGTTRMGT
jgi:hypothetical protein